jgi:uncharacterized phage protein gp47/JayE
MVTIRSVNEIILSLLDFFQLAQPNLDTKPGTVARDLFVDAPASQLSLLYDELSGVSSKQSLRLVVGSDLDRLSTNYGLTRKQSTPSSGTALLTFSSITATININAGAIVVANNGTSFGVVNGIAVTPSAINFYRSVASKFSAQLAFAGITDTLAVQVTVTATSPGTIGNIGSFALNTTNIPGVSNVTNVNAFNGGTDQETDAAFRNRVLATFSGSSVGTALGYLNVALGTTGVNDAYVVQPGDPLMTRDGSIVNTINGVPTVVSEGSGGKVDIVVLGSTLVNNSDTFIYQDKSNNNDPTSVNNNFVLGQIAADAGLTVNQKRINDIANGEVPAQPVSGILQVTGSLSGSNFQPKSIDSLGRVFGNYALLPDTGVYAGSPWGFDTFHWISNKISLFSEDLVKGQFNGQDATTFTGITEIPQVQQIVSITNENSTVTSDRSLIQLLHTPATNVTRVYNVNTGERYTITNQNYDQTGTYNTTGRIQISGNTLPSPSDLLQVDYNWVINFDQYTDYDGLVDTKNPRPVTDSIDWGYASAVVNEKILFTETVGNNFFVGTSSQPIGTVISANSFVEADGYVTIITTGSYTNRLAVVINDLAVATTTVNSIKLKNSNVELFSTPQNNGIITNISQVAGIYIVFTTTIILPTDTTAIAGNYVTTTLNSTNVFSSTLTQGSSNGTQITIPTSLLNTSASSIILSVNYISSIPSLFNEATTTIPSSRMGNGFVLNNNNGFNNFSIANISRRENQTVQLNLSNQYYVELNLPNTDFGLVVGQILSVIRLADGYQLWSTNHPGTIAVGSDGNYQLILSGFNNPLQSDRVLVIYYATDVSRFQPFVYSNSPIHIRSDVLGTDPISGKFVVPLNNIITESNLTFSVIQPNTNIVLFSGTDGYVVNNNDGTATFSSLSVNFDTLPNLIYNKVVIEVPTILSGNTNCNNDGVYDILSYNLNSNAMNITNILNNITADQISVVRLLDGQEIWNYSGTIDLANNRVIIPIGPSAIAGEQVFTMFFNFQNLRKAPTRLVATTTDQVTNTGIITINGTTLAKANNIVFTATSTGLKQDLTGALRTALSLSSSATIPSNIKIAKIIRVSKVVTASPTNSSVLETLVNYDVEGTTIQSNLFYSDEMNENPSLAPLSFILPSTTTNTINTVPNNLPTVGDSLQATFYYTTTNDSENLSYTQNGTLYTNKIFALINKIYVASGFNSSQSTTLALSSFNQPNLGARYTVFYDYTAPKQNERIVVNYNYNSLISTVTFNVEAARPINADVLVKAAQEVELDLTMNIVINPTMLSSTSTIIQNLNNQLITALTTTTLGQIVDQPTLINVAQAVSGIARARILYFNVTGEVGTVLQVQAQNNQYFSANNIIINTETR